MHTCHGSLYCALCNMHFETNLLVRPYDAESESVKWNVSRPPLTSHETIIFRAEKFAGCTYILAKTTSSSAVATSTWARGTYKCD